MSEIADSNQVVDLSAEERLAVLAELLLEIIMEEELENDEND